jgi:hypothetical protein
MRKRYPSNAYALLFEVGNATGFGCNRHADALAVSLWPSRGLDVIGFEFKASRSDWVKERDTPEKSEAVLQFCDQWYLVASDESIVQPGELPDTWGMFTLTGQGTLKAVKVAPKLEAKPWTREFVAAVMRCAADPVAAIDNAALMRAREEGRMEEAKRSKQREDGFQKQFLELQRKVSEFEDHAGVTIAHRWHGTMGAKEFRAALASLSDGSHELHLERLRQIRREVSRVNEQIERDVTAIEAIAGVTRETGEKFLTGGE